MARSKAAAADQDRAAKTPAGRGTAKLATVEAAPPAKRSYLKQSDVPTASLDDALRLPQAIFDHYAGKPTAPFNVAKALNVDPKGSQLRLLSGAAMAFGLIEGGAQATAISVTDLARSIIRPKAEDEDVEAKREAVLRPRIFGEFLRNYDGNVFPRQDIALNVLEDMGVPRDRRKRFSSASVRARVQWASSKNSRASTTFASTPPAPCLRQSHRTQPEPQPPTTIRRCCPERRSPSRTPLLGFSRRRL